MAKLLIVGTHGTDDPTRASMPFHIGKGAVEAGYEVGIVLANDAPLIMKDQVRDTVQGVGMPALKELFQFAVSNNVRVYI
jgi:predicted peroxiredoxin